MRIRIRRCLSMLRNTSDGNELALPATNAFQKYSTGYSTEDLVMELLWNGNTMKSTK